MNQRFRPDRLVIPTRFLLLLLLPLEEEGGSRGCGTRSKLAGRRRFRRASVLARLPSRAGGGTARIALCSGGGPPLISPIVGAISPPIKRQEN